MASLVRETSIMQSLIDVFLPHLRVQSLHEKDLTGDILDTFLSDAPRTLGYSAAYAPSSGALNLLTICNGAKVLAVQFKSMKAGKSRSPRQAPDASRSLLWERLLVDETLVGQCRYGFDMDNLSLSLYKDHGLYIANAVDLQSVCKMKGARMPLTTIKFVVGDTVTVNEENVTATFANTTFDPKQTVDVIQRAWVSWYLVTLPGVEEMLRVIPRITTSTFSDLELDLLAKNIRDTQRRDNIQSNTVAHDYSMTRTTRRNNVEVRQDRFQSRMQRTSYNQDVRMEIQSPEGSFVMTGRAVTVDGRRAEIKPTMNLNLEGKIITRIQTVGTGSRTNAEVLRSDTILDVLQRKTEIFNNPWLQYIYQDESTVWPDPSITSLLSPPLQSPSYPLNNSQVAAVEHMLATTEDHRITIIQGPPGTGKTSVIAQFVVSAIMGGRKGIWLVAQSNIAVKNIAEKLSALGFLDWRLLVSKEFQKDWHEHLYTEIRNNMIVSDELAKFSPAMIQKKFPNCQVILCTLSMLSSPYIRTRGLTALIPVETLVIDEASQIDLGDYVSIFSIFSSTLRKLCFIGDDKQLPPFGQETIEDLKSIFEVPHLQDSGVFLDTQYRMPPHLGNFISQHVYDGELKSNLLHPVTNPTCFFIDVDGGKEELRETSWVNVKEQAAVAYIAKRLEQESLSYRVITPYDAQRTALEEYFKSHDLTYKDKCFNVDSFQGNEDDYIILSLVRTQEVGFLKNLRRTNVMLTRCKRGLFICTTRAFLKRAGASTLVGQMAAEFGEDAWMTKDEFKKYEF